MERHDGICIRSAASADARTIARIHVAAWQETYAGLMPDALLANLSVEDRAARWEQILEDPTSITLLLEQHGEAVGFSNGGPQRSGALLHQGFDGELNAIYLLRAAQGRGLGRALVQGIAVALRQRGFCGMSLWVLRENYVARAFYERLGGTVVAEQEAARDDARWPRRFEVAYGWPDLNQLA